MTPRLVLASKSPQRSAILAQLGVEFEVRPADVEERERGEPAEVARENALAKARAVASAGGHAPVLGVDTVVALDGRLYGKAADAAQARSFLEALSGRTHEVWSAAALIEGGGERVGESRTAVTFRELDGRLVDWYLGTGEWRERAGAYAVQGHGAALVERVDGDYTNVVGLPVPLLLQLAPDLLFQS
jgi:septum formation protein